MSGLNQQQKISVFDLDGTLTKPGFSLWNLITRSLVTEPTAFDRIASKWNQMLKTPDATQYKEEFLEILKALPEYENNATWEKLANKAVENDIISSSQAMTEIGIRMIPKEKRNAKTVQNTAQEITLNFQTGIIIEIAIKLMEQLITSGMRCIISTANYIEGARGFVDALVMRQLLTKKLAKQIEFSGTKIDWARATVIHMNADANKILDLQKLLQNSPHPTEIKFIFVDEPNKNDRALLSLTGCKKYVIKHAENMHANIPQDCDHLDWTEICKLLLTH